MVCGEWAGRRFDEKRSKRVMEEENRMCGRYYVDSEDQILEMREIIEEINRKYSGTEALAQMKTGEIFPTNIAPVINVQGAELMAWGFPMHGKSQAIINARQETALERPMFAKSVRERRIVVPTTGFYEWSHEGKKSVDKYLFKRPDEDMLYLAGIYTEYHLPTDVSAYYAILTTESNKSISDIHNRMPVHLSANERNLWIFDGKFTEEALRREQPELIRMKVDKRPKQEQMSLL